MTNKTVLIMDEVDGMSSGDRGGVGALNALIKKTKVIIPSFPIYMSLPVKVFFLSVARTALRDTPGCFSPFRC